MKQEQVDDSLSKRGLLSMQAACNILPLVASLPNGKCARQTEVDILTYLEYFNYEMSTYLFIYVKYARH